jgi:hypothetical protein
MANSSESKVESWISSWKQPNPSRTTIIASLLPGIFVVFLGVLNGDRN